MARARVLLNYDRKDDHAGMALSQASSECLKFLASVHSYARASIENYQRTHDQYVAYLKSQGFSDEPRHFTTETVMSFCSYLGGIGIHPNTILNKIHGLSTLARWLMKQQNGRGKPMLSTNPTLGWERPRGITPQTKFLLPDEMAKFLSVPLDPELALARGLLVDTGMRCLEACEANVSDLHDVNGTVYLTLQVKGRRQAGGEPASIPLSAECAANVVESIRQRGVSEPAPDNPLLLSPQGKRFTRSQLTQAMIRVGQRAGLTRLTSSPHKLRHTANVVARMAGVDALTRASMLNHRSLKTLARYDHLVAGETAKGRQLQRAGLDKYLAGSTAISQPGAPLGKQTVDV